MEKVEQDDARSSTHDDAGHCASPRYHCLFFNDTVIWKTLQQEGGQVMLLIQVSSTYSANCFSWSVAVWARNCSNIGRISPSGRNGRATSLRTYWYVPLSWLYWCWSPSSWIWKKNPANYYICLDSHFLLLSRFKSPSPQVAQALRLATVSMTLRNSVILRVCMGI